MAEEVGGLIVRLLGDANDLDRVVARAAEELEKVEKSADEIVKRTQEAAEAQKRFAEGNRQAAQEMGKVEQVADKAAQRIQEAAEARKRYAETNRQVNEALGGPPNQEERARFEQNARDEAYARVQAMREAAQKIRAEQGAGNPPGPLSGGRQGIARSQFEQDVRDEMAFRIKEMRNTARQARVEEETRNRLGLPGNEELQRQKEQERQRKEFQQEQKRIQLEERRIDKDKAEILDRIEYQAALKKASPVERKELEWQDELKDLKKSFPKITDAEIARYRNAFNVLQNPAPNSRNAFGAQVAIGTALPGPMGGIAGQALSTGYQAQQMGMTGAASATLGTMVAAGALFHLLDQSFMEMRREAMLYNAELRTSSRLWGDMAHGTAFVSSDLGKELRQKAIEARELQAQIHTQKKVSLGTRGLGQTAIDLTGYLGTGLVNIVTGSRFKSPIAQEIELAVQKIKDAIEQEDRLRQDADQAEKVEVGRRVQRRAFDVQQATVAAQPEGPARAKQETEAQIAREEFELDARHEDDRRRLEIAQREEIEAAKKAKDVGKIAMLPQEHREQNQRLWKEQHDEQVTQQKTAAAKRLALARDIQTFEINQEAEAVQGRIRATSFGYEREEQMTRERGKARVAQLKRAGYDTKKQEEINALELVAMKRDRDYTLRTQMKELEGRAAIAADPAQRMRVEWERTAEAQRHVFGVTTQVLDKFKAAFDKAFKAEADFPLRQAIRNLAVELELAQKKIMPEEATRRRLEIANPNADPRLVAQQARMEEKVRTTQWADQELSQVRPELAMRNYIRQIRAALGTGTIDKDTADLLLRKGQSDTGVGVPMNAGQFHVGWGGTTSYAAGLLDVNKLNMDIPTKTLERITDENGKTLIEIRDRLGSILVKETLN